MRAEALQRLIKLAIDTMTDSGLPITQAASANQKVTNDIPREKPEEWPPSLAHKLKHRHRAKDWWIPYKTGEKKIVAPVNE